MRPPRHGDTGDIVVGWLVRLVASLAVVGVLLFDGVSLGVARLEVVDQAADASRVASGEMVSGHTAQDAYDAAWQAVVSGRTGVDMPVESFSASPDGTVSATVRRTVPTLVLRHVPRSEGWLTVTSTSVHTRE